MKGNIDTVTFQIYGKTDLLVGDLIKVDCGGYTSQMRITDIYSTMKNGEAIGDGRSVEHSVTAAFADKVRL